MRVLMLCSEYPPAKVFGLGRAVHDLSCALTADGDEVHVLTNSLGGRDQDVVVDGVSVHRINFPNPPRPPDATSCVIQFNISLLERAQEVLPSLGELDVIHAHDWLVSLAAVSLRDQCQVPLVSTFHDTAMGKYFGVLNREQQYISFSERWLAGESDRVIVCSSHVRDEIIQHCGIPPSRIDVIPCGVDPAPFGVAVNLPAFRDVLAGPEERVILYVGRLDPEKGVEVLVRAFARLDPEAGELRLVIVGEGQRAEMLQQLAEEVGVRKQVTFLGYVSHPALAAVFRAAELVVVPSLYEPFGMVALEAMAAGRPVVASDAGGLGEIVTSEETGLCVPCGDERALAGAMERLLGDPGFAASLAASGRERALREYSWQRAADRTRQCYSRVLRRDTMA
jgi:glycogen(starch) synthase